MTVVKFRRILLGSHFGFGFNAIAWYIDCYIAWYTDWRIDCRID